MRFASLHQITFGKGAIGAGFFLVCLVVGISTATPAVGQAPSSQPSIEQVELGLDGQFKLGFWTRLQVTLRGGDSEAECQLSWTAPDGEGVNVKAADGAAFRIAPGETLVVERLIRIGRTRCEVIVELTSATGERFDSHRTSIRPEMGLMRSDELLVVEVGADSGFERWLLDRSNQSDEQVVNFVRLDAPDALPTDWVALQGVDLMIVSSSNADLWSDEHRPNWQTIRRWVSDGGALVLCSGSQGAALAAEDSPLQELLPGRFDRVIQQASSAGAEMFTAASEQLIKERGQTFSASRLAEVQGEVLAYEGQSSDELPLVVLSDHGMGRVLWVAVDLDQAPFARWKGRSNFVGKLVDAIFPDVISDENGRRGRVAHLGYNDLSGQLRCALDEFDQIVVVTFTTVAVLVTLFILLIGPGDFWLLKLVFRRMEWTWLTSGIVIVLFSGLAVVLFGVTKGNRVQINQAELIDINAMSGEVRGSIWAHVYSPQLRQFDLRIDRTNDFSQGEGRTLLTWQGLSGTGLGGMDSPISSNLMQTRYLSKPNPSNANTSNQLQGLAIQVASTRPLTARWWDRLTTDVESNLYADSRNNSLHGDLTNPLPYTLDRATIYYDTWAYEVNGDIDPGETISIEGQTVEKTIESVLSRRKVVEGNDITEPWDPKGVNIARIIEMLSFYRAAGGRNYTSLSNRMNSELDWSGLLEQGQAVLLARINEPVARLHDGESSLVDDYDQQIIMIRILLPVEQR